jgi:heme oxygenase (staphylobilin-producing)
MYIVTNRIEVPEEHRQRAIAGFEHAAPSMKQFTGFDHMELWTDESDHALLAVSYWTTQEAYKAYINSDTFRQHHGGASQEQSSTHANVSYYTGQAIR